MLKCSCDFLHISPLLAPDTGPELGIIWKRGTFLYICMHTRISTPHTHEATREPDTTSTAPTDSHGNLKKGKVKKGFHTPKVTHCLRCKPFLNGWLMKVGKKCKSDNYIFLFYDQNFIVSIFMEMGMDLFGNQLWNNAVKHSCCFFLKKKKAEVQYDVHKVSRPSQPWGFCALKKAHPCFFNVPFYKCGALLRGGGFCQAHNLYI